MAIVWGAQSGHSRLGIDVLGSGTGSRTIVIYWQSVAWGYGAFTCTVTPTSGWTGSLSKTCSAGYGATATVEVGRFTITSPRTIGAYTSSPYDGAPSVSRSVSWQTQEPQPASPVIDRAVVVSDTKRRLEWTRRTTYTAVTVQRREWTSKGAWSVWVQRGKPTGNASNFTDTVALGRSYEYRVQGHSAGGSSVWSNILSGVRTEPLPPSNVRASRASETSVRVTWKIEGYGSFSPRVERSVDGGTWVQVAALGDWVQSWTDTSVPVGKPVRYRVRLVVTQQTSLVGAYSGVSNTVTTLVAPAAPTGLAPNGERVETGKPVSLSWTHNSLDTSPQSAAEVEVTTSEGVTVLTVADLSQVEFTPTVAGAVSWRVRTKGSHVDWSPWSAAASLSVADAPWVAVQAPSDEVVTPEIRAVWEFGQDQGLLQSAWEAELVDESGNLLESLSGAGPVTQASFSRRITNGETLEVRVRAAAGTLWSDWADSLFNAVFVPPHPPILNVSWDGETGSHTVSVEPGQAMSGEEGRPETVAVSVEMSVDGGLTWEHLGEQIDPSSVLQTWQGLSHEITMFRATGFTEAGASATSQVDAASESWDVYLGAGPDFSDTARLAFNPKLDVETGRERALEAYEGREKPVAYTGEHTTLTLRIGGTIIDWEEANTVGRELQRIARTPDPLILYRDPLGQRIYGALSSVQMPYHRWGGWDWSLTVTEADM